MKHNSENKLVRLKTCPYCKCEFVVIHELQIYCPEKYGKQNYCKYKQKQLIEENRLAQVASLYSISQSTDHRKQLSTLEHNILVLDKLLGYQNENTVSSLKLDELKFDIRTFSYRITDAEYPTIVLGPFKLSLLLINNLIFTFKISKNDFT